MDTAKLNISTLFLMTSISPVEDAIAQRKPPQLMRLVINGRYFVWMKSRRKNTKLLKLSLEIQLKCIRYRKSIRKDTVACFWYGAVLIISSDCPLNSDIIQKILNRMFTTEKMFKRNLRATRRSSLIVTLNVYSQMNLNIIFMRIYIPMLCLLICFSAMQLLEAFPVGNGLDFSSLTRYYRKSIKKNGDGYD